MSSSSKRRKSKYSKEFKQDAVTLTKERSMSSVARDLGIPLSILSRWRQQHFDLSMPDEDSMSHKNLLVAYKDMKESSIKIQRDQRQKDEKKLW